MRPLVLIILDGFGYPSNDFPGSPFAFAKQPIFKELEKNYPFTLLQASGLAVGLPFMEPGNSEVGHLTIGSGKIIYNHLPRIISSIKDGTFFENPAFISSVEHIKNTGGALHLMGLFSSGSVHAYAEHLYALLDFCKLRKIEKVYLHLFTDGRDAPLFQGADFIKELETKIEEEYPNVKIASVIGRYFAMDRQQRWQDMEQVYKVLTEGGGEAFETASLYVKRSYEKGSDDETIKPGNLSSNIGRVRNGDAVVFFNYREDSARELTAAFVEDDFSQFSRKKLDNLVFTTMTQYSPNLKTLVAFSPLAISFPLSEVISIAGLTQIHIAESEKYAHVTYFFNGGAEKPFEKEDRIFVQSPLNPKYDEVPEMSAGQVTKEALRTLGQYDFTLVNFANADMVGHTGNFDACVRAIEALDEYVGQIISKALEENRDVIVTADHGNIEEKRYSTGEKRTSHTTNPVPFFMIGKDWKRGKQLKEADIKENYKKIEGTLSDVAPTVLEILELKKPNDMTGKSLLSKLK